MNNEERWAAISGYEGIYEVSSFGRVRRSLRSSGTKGDGFIKPTAKPNGYLRVKLRNAGNDTDAHVHRLVALAFIPNAGNRPQVNHIDGTRNNNRVENLEWMTARENLLYKTRVMRRGIGSQRGTAKLTELDIPKIFEARRKGKFQYQIAREFGVCRAIIGEILQGIRWRHVQP